MSIPAHQNREPDLRLLKFAAPIVLSTLACLQIMLAMCFGLSPWKGGGFGLFSTVDNSKGRSIRVYLETSEGEVPAQAPSWLGNRISQVRTFPAEFRVRKMAADLAAATWVYRTGPSPEGAEDSKPSGVNSDPAMKSAIKKDLNRDGEAAKRIAREASMGDRPYPQVESLRPSKEIGPRVALGVNAVRVEIWRERFDVDSNEIRLEFITKATSKAIEP